MADVISVTALNKYVRAVLESDVVLTDIAIRGEISGFVRNYKSGHCYFSLRDEKTSVKAVLFAGHAENLSFVPENGMQVVVRGRISLYERDGAFQVYVEFMFMDGTGAAHLAFEKLRARLEQEGLFASEAKKALPAYPGCVGLVTSKTGAALQDILKMAQERCPTASFLLASVSVQGQAAVPQIVKAIKTLDARQEVDLILVARGGGSPEDLWIFNAEDIARAAFACQTPLVSAIGHEIDFTILDFVADLRAPTPSAAVELALPDMRHAEVHMMNIFMNIRNNMQQRHHSCYSNITQSVRRLRFQSPGAKLQGALEHLARIQTALPRHMREQTAAAELRLKGAAALAESLNPYGVLARGYGMVQKDGQLLCRAEQAAAGDAVEFLLQDGQLHCEVKDVRKGAAKLGGEKQNVRRGNHHC